MTTGNPSAKSRLALDRPPSTVSRELRRNRGKQVGYRPSHAHEQAKARRWTGSRLERDGELRRLVLRYRLRHGWSPEQIAGRLACDKAATGISHESIYRFIYAQIRRTNDGSWRHYLRQGQSQTSAGAAAEGGSSASSIKGRVSIAQRPEAANGRPSQDIGEADLMLFKTYGQAIAGRPTSASPVASSSPDSHTELPNPPRDHPASPALDPLALALRRIITGGRRHRFPELCRGGRRPRFRRPARRIERIAALLQRERFRTHAPAPAMQTRASCRRRPIPADGDRFAPSDVHSAVGLAMSAPEMDPLARTMHRQTCFSTAFAGLTGWRELASSEIVRQQR